MKEIMNFIIQVTPDDINQFYAKSGVGSCFIPFTGYVKSELFTGKILPGACDVQVVNPAGYRTMTAQYMFEGTDQAGKQCHLFVKNEAVFTPDAKEGEAFRAVPIFITDSEELAPYLHTARFTSKGHGVDPTTIEIKIFDMWQ